MEINNQVMRFDWAMKRLLRQKANFGVLEGLLTTLLGEQIKIQRLLESESNQDDEFSKCIDAINQHKLTESIPIFRILWLFFLSLN